MCEHIVIPNIRLRDDMEEMFEMNWVEYVRRDTEGSDNDTRRRAATDLVKALTARFEAQVGPDPVIIAETAPDMAGLEKGEITVLPITHILFVIRGSSRQCMQRHCVRPECGKILSVHRVLPVVMQVAARMHSLCNLSPCMICG